MLATARFHYKQILKLIDSTNAGTEISYDFGSATPKDVVMQVVTKLFTQGYGVDLVHPAVPVLIKIDLFPETDLASQIDRLVNKHLRGVAK